MKSTATKDMPHVVEPLGSFRYLLPCVEPDETIPPGFIQIHFSATAYRWQYNKAHALYMADN